MKGEIGDFPIFFVMISKIKQNILPILTGIILILSAIIVVNIAFPKNNKAEDNFTETGGTETHSGWTITIGNYTGGWTLNGKSFSSYGYTGKNAQYLQYKLPTFMKISRGSETYEAFCITPTEDNNGNHTLTNAAIRPYSDARMIGCAFSTLGTWWDKQSAMRVILAGWENIGPFADPKDPKKALKLKYQGPGTSTETNVGSIIGQSRNSGYQNSVTNCSGKPEAGQIKSPKTVYTNGSKSYYRIGFIHNKDASKLSVKNTGSSIIYYCTGSSSASAIQSGYTGTISSGSTKDMSQAAWVQLYVDATTAGSASWTYYASDRHRKAWTAKSDMGDQQFLFLIPSDYSGSGSASWQPTTTTWTLYKKNANGTGGLAGATIKVTGPGYSKQQTTTGNGLLTFDGLKIGETYTVTEVQAPKGYKKFAEFTFVAKAGGSSTAIDREVTDELEFGGGGFTKAFYWKDYGKIPYSAIDFSGLNFYIYVGSTPVKFDKDTNGVYKITEAKKVPVGEYEIYEDGVVRYKNEIIASYNNYNTHKKISISKSSTGSYSSQFTINNEFDTYEIGIVKKENYYPGDTNYGNPLANAHFSVTDPQGNAVRGTYNSINGTYTWSETGTTDFVTNSNGLLIIKGLPLPGVYTFTETQAPPNYQLYTNHRTTQVRAVKTGTLGLPSAVVGNGRPRGGLRFDKLDAAVQNAPYIGATFRLKYENGQYISSSCIQGSNGSFSMIDDLSTVPSIFAGTAGAAIITTDNLGRCQVTNLICGSYTIEEVSTNSPYYSVNVQMNQISGVVTANKIADLGDIKNYPDEISFKLVKQDEWGNLVKVSSFIVYQEEEGAPSTRKQVTFTGSNGSYVYSGTGSAGTQVTTNNGNLSLTKLPEGTRTKKYIYYIQEKSTSSGFVVDPNIYTFDEINKKAQKFENTRDYGEVTIVKNSALNGVNLAGAKFTLTFVSDDVGDGKGAQSSLSNAPVEASAVSGSDGAYRFVSAAATSKTTTFVTNSQGQFKVTGLPFGTYLLTETAAPANYELPANRTYTFVINSTNKSATYAGSIIKQPPLVNTPITGPFEFTKIGNVDAEVIADCIFTLECIESAPLNVPANGSKYLTFTGKDGNYILEDSNYTAANKTADGAKFELKTDSNGHCKVDKLPVGTYKLTEKGCSNPNSEYVLIEGTQSGINYTLNVKSTFKMIQVGSEVKMAEDASVQNGFKILENTRKTGNLEFTKLDADTKAVNSRLSTCKFVIKMKDLNVYMVLDGSNGTYTYNSTTRKKSNATQFSVGTNGKAVINNLPVGTYEITEISTDKDNIYKLNTTPVEIKVLAGQTGTGTMSNTPWGGKLTFVKKTEHGTFYPNCDKECEFYLKATGGANSGKFAVLKLDETTKQYQFISFVQSQNEATKFTTNLSVTDSKGRSANAKAIIFDIPVGTYQIVEVKTGSNYDLAKATPTEYAIKLLRDQVDVEKLDINVGLPGEMINYVLKSKVNLIKEMTDSVLTINGAETQITPDGFKASIIGTSVTTAPIVIKYESDASGNFNITEFTIDGVAQKSTEPNYVELPFGEYVISEYDIDSNPKYGRHAHLDSITKTSAGTTTTIWDRIQNTVDGNKQSVSHTCQSTDNVTFKLTNIIDNPDLTVVKSNGATPQENNIEALAFIDTDIMYNVSGMSNEFDTHNADITITDYPEKIRMSNGEDCKLAIRSITIPGYSKIENGTSSISYSVDIYGRNNQVLKSIPKTELPASSFTIDDLSPNVDTSETDYGMCNIEKIVIKYYNFPARSKMIDNAAIVYKFRLGGELQSYQTTEINPATGKYMFKTFNDVELRHSFLTDIATDDANQPIKKVNIHKLNINKLINSIVNNVDYSKNNYTFAPDYTSFKFEIAGVLISEDEKWENYIDVKSLDSNGKIEIAIPYGVYRLQELHTDGYNDQKGYNLIVDAEGVFIQEQVDGLDYINWSDATNVTGAAKILNYNNMQIQSDANNISYTITPKPASLEKLEKISEKSLIQKVEKTITNTLSTGKLILNKETTIIGDEDDAELSKEGYKVIFEGTSYAGVSFKFNLISDADGCFIPDNETVSGFNASDKSFRIPDGKYSITEHSIPDLVVLDNIVFNGKQVWTRETDVEDASTTDVTTNVIVEKDPVENKGIITNTTNTKVYDEYEFTELTFNKVFIGKNGIATKDDFDRIALDNIAEYNFRLTLTNQETGLKYTGLLNSKNGISFYNLPFGTYLFEENSEMLFEYVNLEILSGAHNVKLEKKEDKYFITLDKVPNDSEATAEFNVSNKLSDFRGYASVDSVPNLITGDKSSTKSVLTITVTDFDNKLLSSATVEIYAENDLNTPINFRMVDGQVSYAPTQAEGTFTSVEIGETGYVKIYGLPDGKYIIKQTKTADGYRVIRTNSPVIIAKDNGGSDIFLYQSLAESNSSDKN